MSSKRAIRRKACGGKRSYETQAEAITAACCMRRDRGENLYPYRCKFCTHFHIGHNMRLGGRFGINRMRL